MIKCVNLIFVFALFVVTSCQFGPVYEAPEPNCPQEWKHCQEQVSRTPVFENWWSSFQDPILENLMEQALAHNYSLNIALERVEEARAYAGLNRANLFPQLSFNPNYRNTEKLIKFFDRNAEVLPSGKHCQKNGVIRAHELDYSIPFDLSYQLDLWGKIRGQYQSAFYSAQAQEEAYKVALLTLTTDLAAHYFELRTLDAQIDLFKRAIEIRCCALEINESKYQAGLINYTDVTRAALELSNSQFDLTEAQRQRAIKENSLAVIIGTPSPDFNLDHNPLSLLPPAISSGIPSDILLRRPDIAEAERRIASENALIGVAYAAFFPSIDLTGALGFSSPDLKHFLKWKSRLYSFGANIFETVFDGGRNQSNLEIAWSRFQQADDLYQQKVLEAFQEVEDALANLEFQMKEKSILENSVNAAKETTALSLERYTKGLVIYLDVVDGERSELHARSSDINVLGNLYLSTIQLIKALGGNWDEIDIESLKN